MAPAQWASRLRPLLLTFASLMVLVLMDSVVSAFEGNDAWDGGHAQFDTTPKKAKKKKKKKSLSLVANLLDDMGFDDNQKMIVCMVLMALIAYMRISRGSKYRCGLCLTCVHFSCTTSPP